MPLGKRIQPYTAQRVTFGSTYTAAQIMSNLDDELRKAKFTPYEALVAEAIEADDKDAYEYAVKSVVGDTHFMMFGTIIYDNFMHFYNEGKKVPVMRRYNLGNPLIAQTMIKHDYTAPLQVPVKLLVLGDPSGTLDIGEGSIVYDLPSSLIVLDPSNTLLKAAAEALDAKLEALVRKVTGN